MTRLKGDVRGVVSMGMSQHERRRDIRIRAVLPAEHLLRGRKESLEIIEVSYRGLQLRMPEAPVLNALLKLRVELPTRAIILFPVPLRATSHRGGVAVGCKLFALSGADKDAWHDYVSFLLKANAQAA